MGTEKKNGNGKKKVPADNIVETIEEKEVVDIVEPEKEKQEEFTREEKKKYKGATSGYHHVDEEPEKKEKKPSKWKGLWIGLGVFFLIAALVMSSLGLYGMALNKFSIADSQKDIEEIQGKIDEILTEQAKIEDNQNILGEKLEHMEKVNTAQNGKDAEDLLYVLSEIGRIDKAMAGKEDKLIPPEIPVGFTPDEGVIDISKEVNLSEIPDDITPYRIFPDVKGVWGEALAGYNFGYNDAFVDSDRFGNTQIPTWSWVAYTGEEMNLPGFGSLKDKDGGAVLAVIINVWETPGEFLKAYILHGFWGTGEVWDMSDMTDNPPVYGENTLKTLAVIRNHYINQLGSDEPNPEFRGQTGKGDQAPTITWAVALRWYDGTFRLVDSGQWVRGQ
jgi:hypothetical protein